MKILNVATQPTLQPDRVSRIFPMNPIKISNQSLSEAQCSLPANF